MRSIRLPASVQRRAVFAVGAVVAVALVAGSLAWPKGGTPTAALSPSPSGIAGPGASIDPTVDGWTAVADLSAVGATGPVVPIDASFRLASLGTTAAADLAGRLTVEPKIDFTVAPDGDSGAVRLTPSEPLIAGAVYRFTLAGTSGEQLDSWAFQAEQPVRIVGTLPGNQEADVPVDTGIEITFDQDGVTDVASHVTIEPATKGRFEQHGRVTVFVPDALKPATIYKVTVTRGITVAGTDESMAADYTFAFETTVGGSETDAGEPTFQLQEDLFESATANAPIIGLWAFSEEDQKPKSARIEVYRLANLDAAVGAFEQLRSSPRWSRWSTEGQVATAGLPKVLAIDAKLNDLQDAYWLTLPDPLPSGWYLVQLPTGTRPIQAILQVTDVSGYLVVSNTQTLVWANDLATGGPIAAATVATAEGGLGRTDKSGLLMAATPEGLLPEARVGCDEHCAPVVTIRTADGREAFLSASGQQDKFEFYDAFYGWGESDPRFWTLLNTDRSLYRPTDTVNVWGVIRDRDSGEVPSTIKVQLEPPSSDIGAGRPPVTTLTIKPGPTGTFTGSISLAGLPEGYYSLSLLDGKDQIRSVGISIAPILKPAYRIDVTTGRRVYVAGDQIKITANATFFEGTPVSGVPLRIDGIAEGDITTDATGTAIKRTVASAIDDTSGPRYETVYASPARAEEGEIAGASREIIIFPSSRMVDATSTIEGGQVRVTGTVHQVDVDRLEREITQGAYVWELDPRGKAVASTNVSAHFVELIPVKTRTGTEYDFITKKAVPIYEYDTVERDAGTKRVKTNAKGEYGVAIAVAAGGHDYYVTLTIGDADGHKATTTTYASSQTWSLNELRRGGLVPTDPRSIDPDGFAVGDKVDLTLADPDAASPAKGGRYLFFVAQRGLRTATVQASSRYVSTFESWAPPNIDIGGVRFTGHGYTDGGRYNADFREADRRLSVDLTVASARYRPGDDVTVEVTTRDRDGSPVAATVVLRAVDEKLFSIGGADSVDPLGQLYAQVGSGIVATYQSHRPPYRGPDGADTGGGGDDREDFRDSLLFKAIDTGPDGRGSAAFTLSDDLTAWRISASAISVDLEAGEGTVQVPVGLPFFVDASIAPEYLAADHPTIQVRTYGAALAAGAPVKITVSSESLGFTSGPIDATAFTSVGVPLPDLRLGAHRLTISATTGSGSTALKDTLIRQIVVIGSRLASTRTGYVDLAAGVQLHGGDGLTTVVLSDAGAGRHLPLLLDLASGGGARLDSALAVDLAASLLRERFGQADADEPPPPFAIDPYQTPDGGLALLPYASSDVELSALVAIVAPDRVDASSLEAYLNQIRTAPEESRERQMYALAGLAGLGAPVLPAIRAAAADTKLTIREQLMIGLGAAALGDTGTARSIERSLVTAYGEGVGAQARLRAGSSAADLTAATALMAALAAATGDVIAPAYWAYVEANPSTEALQVLPAIAYITGTLDRLAGGPASFAYTIDGVREVVKLERGESFELTLTAAQLDGVTFEKVSGDVGIATTWRAPIAASDFEPDPDIAITRNVSPAGAIGADDLVRVEIHVTFGPKAPTGCHQVTDLVPSGLVPIGSLAAWVDPENEPVVPAPGAAFPYLQSGQRVFFCADRDLKHPQVDLVYFARVVTTGTFVWEPAVAESRTGPDRAALTPQVEVKIR